MREACITRSGSIGIRRQDACGRTTPGRTAWATTCHQTRSILALHGSSTIPVKVGYKVVRVVMKEGLPVGIEDFVTGWLKDGVVSGRPAGLATGPDGALYVSDDNKGFIYRIPRAGSSKPTSKSSQAASLTRSKVSRRVKRARRRTW